MESLRPLVGVGVLIINQRQQILMGQRLKTPGNPWAPPGGHLEYKETFEECACREVLEETGLVISHPQFIGLTNDHFPESHYVTIFMKADFPEAQEFQVCEPEKHGPWRWFSWENLPSPLFLPMETFKNQIKTL